jgi:ABC-type lipoprotein export system ATPase subunit
LGKSFRRGAEEVHALQEVSFTVEPRELVAVVGPSGSGKTTLLNLLGCLDVPTTGTLTIDGVEAQGLSERQLTRLRRERIGFVFQHFGLLPTLTVQENVALPALFSGRKAEQRVREIVTRVGLEHRLHHRPHQLSGGEMQRVAIARALINNPVLLLADEPTGNLDTATGESVIALLRELNAGGLTVVVVTHSERLAAIASRRLVLQDGHLVQDE